MFDRHRVMVSLLFALLVSPALFAQQPRFSGERVPSGQTFVPRSYDQQYRVVTEGTAYGLQEGQGISGAQIVLAERRTDIRTTREDVVGRAGRAVATSSTGAGGGVTFNNVRPGVYVILIRMMEAPPRLQAHDLRHDPPVLIASLASDHAHGRYYTVKSFFESRSNIATQFAGPGGLEWRTFPEGFVYAVRAPNLVRSDEECRRSRDDVYNRETIIAQEFQIGGSAPVTVTAAVGRAARP